MKRMLTFALALVMVFSLAACGNKSDDNKANDNEVTLTAQEILEQLKKSLGDSYASDTAETDDRMSGYYGLDLSKIESWAAESNSSSSMNMDCAVVLKVKDGYAESAAALLQERYEQTLSYARMYNMDLQRVLNARLFVNGNYVALLVEGAQGDWQASDEDQAKFAAEEADKVDAAWKEIFGSSENSIVIPADNSSSGFNFDGDDPSIPDGSGENSSAQETENDTAKKDNAVAKKNDTGVKKDEAPKDNEDNGDKSSSAKPNDAGKDNAKKELTAQEALDSIKKSLGSSYTSDTAETGDRMSGYYGLDLSKIESWAAESNSSSSMNMDCAVVLKVKDGYAESAAALLQERYEQTLSYARMYNIDLQRVLNARLFVNGNYVALLIEGTQGDWQASDEDQAKFAAEEAVKVDDAWKAIFGSAENSISIPEDNGSSGFDMSDSEENNDDLPMLGG